MERQLRPCTSSEQGRPVTCNEPCSFSSRFLCRILQLSVVKYLLKFLQKASVWIGFVVPVETIICKVYPTPSPTRPRRLARKHRGRLTRLLLSAVPTRIQAILGYLPADWGRSNKPKGKSCGLLEHLKALQQRSTQHDIKAQTLEALITPSKKANKRKRDDVALEEQETLLVVLERDLPDDDSEDLLYEPSDVETDSEEYKSQNDTETDLEIEEQDGTIMLKDSSDLQVENIQPTGVSNTPELLAASMELGPEAPAGSSGGEDAPDSGDAQKPRADVSSVEGSEQEADTDCDESSSLSQYEDKQEP